MVSVRPWQSKQTYNIQIHLSLTGLLLFVAFAAGDFLAAFFGGAAFFTEPFLVTNFLAAALLMGVFAFAPDLVFAFAADTKSSERKMVGFSREASVVGWAASAVVAQREIRYCVPSLGKAHGR